MVDIVADSRAAVSPLEDFVRSYLETIGGAWDEVEPQVYDVLLPSGEAAALFPAADGALPRITFDPEALPEHPGTQLASFGTPFIDQLLNDAIRRGRPARFYLVGLNLAPHDLAVRVRRALTLSPGLELHVERVRALDFPQAVFWFQAEFVSDQKEQEILPVAMDLHYRRQVRHLDKLLDPAHLAEQPALPRPEARHAPVAAVFPEAREQVLRSLASLAHVRSRELSERLEQQITRMTRYYADLRAELEEQGQRARDKDEAATRLAARREAIGREEQLRIAELRQKATLRVHLRLLLLVVIQQPKLLLHARLAAPDRPAGPLELVWDPLEDALEAPPCPECQRPTYAFDLTRQGRAVCPACSSRLAAELARKGHREPKRP
jgi:hypothetical protein